jgi:hypothetical protein
MCVDHWLGRSLGQCPEEWIVQACVGLRDEAQRRLCVCGLLTWQVLGACASRDCQGLRVGSLGESGPGGTD